MEKEIEDAINHRDEQIRSWFKIPVYPEEEGKLGRLNCPQCGDGLVRIRGRYPNMPTRDICATCAIESLEGIVGNLYPNNQANQSNHV